MALVLSICLLSPIGLVLRARRTSHLIGMHSQLATVPTPTPARGHPVSEQPGSGTHSSFHCTQHLLQYPLESLIGSDLHVHFLGKARVGRTSMFHCHYAFLFRLVVFSTQFTFPLTFLFLTSL